MSNEPQLTISGFRGVWGESLTTEIATNYARAFLSLIQEENKNPTILIARDGRESGLEIQNSLINFFQKENVKIVDAGILPTPTVLFSVRKNKYDGAIIVTASHNPIEYNGLKFVNRDAFFLTKDEVEKIKNYYGK